MSQTAAYNDTVTVHYVTRTREGGVIENTTNRKPLVLNLSDPGYTEAFRKSILGMQSGTEKTVLADPEQIFGYRDHNRQIAVPLSGLPSGIQEGDQLTATIQNEEIDAWVIQLSEDEAVLDTNHPLAGETIEYTIQLVSIEPPSPVN